MSTFMKLLLTLVILSGWHLTCGASHSEARAPESRAVGLLPVYNASGEPYGDVFSAFLTVSLFDALSKERWDCLLLNPGTLYSPIDEAPAFANAKAAGAGWIVFLTLKPARRDRYGDSRPEILIEGRVAGVQGAVDLPVTVRHEVKRQHLDGGFDIGPYPRIPRGAAASEYSLWYWYQSQSSRRLAKQPLGKAVLRMAGDLRVALTAALPTFPRRATAAAGAPECDLEFGVGDRDAKWSSKSFTVVVNGRDESAAVRGGVLTVRANPGLKVFEVRMKDAPFGLPVQPVYLASTVLECSRKSLRLEIGPKGEAVLVSEH